MKTKLALFIFVAATLAALAVTYTKQSARVARFQIDTTFVAGTGTATEVQASAFIQTVLTNDADAEDVRKGEWLRVNFNLLDPALASTTITAATKTVTYPQLAALIRQACLDRASSEGISFLQPKKPAPSGTMVADKTPPAPTTTSP